jgi:hypothetical protein
MAPSSHTRRRAAVLVLPPLGALVALLGFAGPARAAATPAQKTPLTQTNRDCEGTVLGSQQTQSFGFAKLTKTGSARLVVEVALKDATPNATYNIRLIQLVTGDPNAEPDCAVIDGTLTTDAVGNGNANVQEPVLPGASTAWVDLNNQDNFAEFFTTKVLSFS